MASRRPSAAADATPKRRENAKTPLAAGRTGHRDLFVTGIGLPGRPTIATGSPSEELAQQPGPRASLLAGAAPVAPGRLEYLNSWRRSMLHVVESAKPLDQLGKDLEAACARHKFGVLGMHDLKAKMTEKGVPFARECRIFEKSGNPHQAKRVLEANLEISTALPCRISVYEEGGEDQARDHPAHRPDRAVPEPRAEGCGSRRSSGPCPPSWSRLPGGRRGCRLPAPRPRGPAEARRNGTNDLIWPGGEIGIACSAGWRGACSNGFLQPWAGQTS